MNCFHQYAYLPSGGHCFGVTLMWLSLRISDIFPIRRSSAVFIVYKHLIGLLDDDGTGAMYIVGHVRIESRGQSNIHVHAHGICLIVSRTPYPSATKNPTPKNSLHGSHPPRPPTQAIGWRYSRLGSGRSRPRHFWMDPAHTCWSTYHWSKTALHSRIISSREEVQHIASGQLGDRIRH